jgi:virginiamycin B lyase
MIGLMRLIWGILAAVLVGCAGPSPTATAVPVGGKPTPAAAPAVAATTAPTVATSASTPTTAAPATRPAAATAGVPTPAASPASTPAAAPAATTSATSAPAATKPAAAPKPAAARVQEFVVPRGSRPHDVAPAADGGVWYTAQGSGELGWLDPKSGQTRHVKLGRGSAPHGVIVGPDGAPWITDGGLNAIVRVDPKSDEVKLFQLPADRPNANLNTATFDPAGILWFTGQNGVYGRVDPKSGKVEAWEAPRGRGPYGITTTPQGEVYYASLAGSHIARIDRETGKATAIDPPTTAQGARRVWSDSKGRIWVSEWNSGQVSVYDPSASSGQGQPAKSWRQWKLPGARPQAYAVYVDERDQVWLTDFGANAIVRFDPASEQFESFPLQPANAAVRQMLGRPGEVWGAASSHDKLIVIRAA